MENIINHGVWIDSYNYANLIKAQSIQECGEKRVISARSSLYRKQSKKQINYNRKLLKK